MRAIFLVFMIALLPLRGWLGDAMAMQMVPGHASATEKIATHASTARAGATFHVNFENSSLPCHDAGAGVDHLSDDTARTPIDSSGPLTQGDCAQCSTCQVCHSVALSPVINPLPLLALPAQAVHSEQTLFVSVPRALHLKPPIS
jgi:hypothetical protein